MLATEQASRLQTRLSTIARAVEEALHAAEALAAMSEPAVDGEVRRWLPAITTTLRQMQLDCAELRYAATELRDGLPSSDTLQPRLLE
jgi:hypothetical protein